jgi:hypothetical protein
MVSSYNIMIFKFILIRRWNISLINMIEYNIKI